MHCSLLAGDLVDELRSKGLDTDMWKTMLTSAFNERDPVDALHTVIGLLRKKLDALQGGPAPAAPNPPAAPPANSAPAVNSVDPAASLRLLLAAPPPPEPADPPPKRRRTSSVTVGGSLQHLHPEFFHQFSKFAFEYGQAQYKRLGTLNTVRGRTIYGALKKQAQIPVPHQMHHYFNRADWIKAVTSGDSSHFCAQRQKTPVPAPLRRRC
jgi:hypothetical protein